MVRSDDMCNLSLALSTDVPEKSPCHEDLKNMMDMVETLLSEGLRILSVIGVPEEDDMWHLEEASASEFNGTLRWKEGDSVNSLLMEDYPERHSLSRYSELEFHGLLNRSMYIRA